jgi:hypothetical protein
MNQKVIIPDAEAVKAEKSLFPRRQGLIGAGEVDSARSLATMLVLTIALHLDFVATV